MTILTGWREQYDRMIRSRDKMMELASGSAPFGDEAKDAMFHFYQDAYHLKDWIKNDPQLQASDKQGIESYVSNTLALSLCADLCNGTKHLGLNGPYPPRTGDRGTGFGLAAKATPATVEARAEIPSGAPAEDLSSERAPAQPSGYQYWEIHSNQQTWNALDMADVVIKRWKHWLRDVKGLPI